MNKPRRRYSDIFGDEPQTGDDVSLENALEASQMKPTRTVVQKVYDFELGEVDEYVTVDVEPPDETGTLREAVKQYGKTFPQTIAVTFTNWRGEQRITDVVGDINLGSVYVVIDGEQTTFNPLSKVTVTKSGN